MARLFIGIAIDAATRASIEHAVQACTGAAPPGLRLLPPDNWHFTLQFLGSVDDAKLAAVHHACAAAAVVTAPFEIELGGAGAFESPRAARVLWIGLTRGAEQIARSYEALLVHTEPLGFAREARAFSAHLTIARAKNPSDARAWLDALRVPPQAMAVSAFTLFRSHTSPRGARYEALEHFALRGA